MLPPETNKWDWLRDPPKPPRLLNPPPSRYVFDRSALARYDVRGGRSCNNCGKFFNQHHGDFAVCFKEDIEWKP